MSSAVGAKSNYNDGKKVFNSNSGMDGTAKSHKNGNKPHSRKPYVYNSHGNQHRNGRPEKQRSDQKQWRNEDGSDKTSQVATPEPFDVPVKYVPKSAPDQLQTYTEEERSRTGQLHPNPEALGFRRKSFTPRSIPKYLLSQPRLLQTPEFVQNHWDSQNQHQMLQKEEASNGNDVQGLYEEFQRMREVERKKMESLGLVDAENTRKDLTDAISFQGSCLDMCPIFERVRRALENNVKNLEKDPTTNKISRTRAVKAFSRPAAGQPPPLPSDVRPPHVLVKTLDYLVDNIVQQLPESHSFIWDRTRSIRQDFTYQNSFGPEAIDCNERIVRLHLLSLHIMAGSDVEYSQQQELEQFNKALQTLIEIYDDVRNHGGQAPNEPEFRAYHLLSHIRDPELEREIQNLPNYIFQDSNVQLALKLRNLISQNNVVERGYSNSVGSLDMFVEFFRTVYNDVTPFLFGCLLETHFNEIRFYALKSMSRSYHTRGKAYPAGILKELLGFDSVQKLIDFVCYYEIDTFNDESSGEVLVDLFNKEKLATKYKLNSFFDKPKKTQTYSKQLDSKIKGKSLKDFINQGLSNRNLGLKKQKQILDAAEVWKKIHKNNSANSSLPVQKQQFGQNNQGQASTDLAPNDAKTQMSMPFARNSTVFPTSDKVSSAPVPGFQPPSLDKAFPQSIQKEQIPVGGNDSSRKFFDRVSVPKASQFDIPAPKPQSIVSSQPAKESFVSLAPKSGLLLNDSKSLQTAKEPVNISPVVKEEPVKRLLKNNRKFLEAGREVVDSIIEDVMQSELKPLLARMIRDYEAKCERKRLIGSLGNELYQAFISEVIFQEAMNAKASLQYDSYLKRKTLKRMHEVGSRLVQQKRFKQQREEELNSISLASSKKVARPEDDPSVADCIQKKKRRILDSSLTAISQKQEEIHKLWAPLDLAEFARKCAAGMNDKDANELQFLIIVENWTSSYSKWLNTKLSLTANMEKKLYERKVYNPNFTLNITSLPSNSYSSSEFFSPTPFVLFECGVTAMGENLSMQQKLSKDRATLAKIAALSQKYSHYRVQILVLVWDVTESRMTTEQISQALDVKKLLEKEDIQDILICDMSTSSKDVDEMLTGGLSEMGQAFIGELSTRGKRKRAKLKKLEQINRDAMNRKAEMEKREALLKEKEAKILEQAKRNKQYGYLRNHASVKPSRDATFSSSTNYFNDTISHISNRSIASRILQKKHDSNTTNSFGFSSANTTLNNISLLTGFGGGVIEESTPSASPNFKNPKVGKPLPRSVQSLRSLTSNIKSRFAK